MSRSSECRHGRGRNSRPPNAERLHVRQPNRALWNPAIPRSAHEMSQMAAQLASERPFVTTRQAQGAGALGSGDLSAGAMAGSADRGASPGS